MPTIKTPNIYQDYPKAQEIKQFNSNPMEPFIQPKTGPRIRATARKILRPPTPLPSPLRKAIKTWSDSSLESSPQSRLTWSPICGYPESLNLNKKLGSLDSENSYSNNNYYKEVKDIHNPR